MTLQKVSALDLRITGWTWPFARNERTRIDGHWQYLAEGNPAIWNGQILLCHDAHFHDGVLDGQFFTTDFASFIAWRDWGWPDRTVRNIFGSAVVLSNDGALIYGRMGQATINVGKLYPPGGSLEPRDIKPDGSVDVLGSIERELEEETGLRAADAHPGDLLVIFDEQRVSLAKAFTFDMTASDIERAAADHIARAEEKELDGVEVLRHSSQIDSRMPGYAAQIARYFLPS